MKKVNKKVQYFLRSYGLYGFRCTVYYQYCVSLKSGSKLPRSKFKWVAEQEIRYY